MVEKFYFAKRVIRIELSLSIRLKCVDSIDLSFILRNLLSNQQKAHEWRSLLHFYMLISMTTRIACCP